MECVAYASAVAHEAAGRCEFRILVDRWYPVAERQSGELIGSVGEKCVGADYESTCSQLSQGCEYNFQIECGLGMQDMDVNPDGGPRKCRIGRVNKQGYRPRGTGLFRAIAPIASALLRG